MRDVEKRTKTGGGQKSTDNAVPVLGSEEKKQLERAVQKFEKRIADLEIDVKKFEEKMADPDFYNRPDSNDQLKKYTDLKTTLASEYADWEKAVERLG